MLNGRFEGSSKIQYRIEQQQQQMRNSARTPNLIKHSPSEDKMSPASPMDDIERGKVYVYVMSLYKKLLINVK